MAGGNGSEPRSTAMNGMVRTIGRLAAVAAVALVLAGSTSPPAEARIRDSAVKVVNGAIDSCFRSGGDAQVTEIGSSFTLTCVVSEGEDTSWEYTEEYPYEEGE
jgi:hypothetical protein